MKNIFLIALFLLLFFQGCSKSQISDVPQNSETNTEKMTKEINASNSSKEISTLKNDDDSSNETPKYLGCWEGAGGKLKITKDKIYDLGNDKSSSYEEKPVTKKYKETQDKQRYILESKNESRKSFPAQLHELEFDADFDKAVSISAYKSSEDYIEDKFSSKGLFVKVLCKEIERN